MTFIQLQPRAISTVSASLIAIASLCLPASAAASPSDGINRLQAATSAKANAANDAAIEQAKPSTGTAQPTATPPPKPGPIQLQRAQRAQMITDGRALLAQAEKVTADYRPKEGGPSKAELDASIGEMKSDIDSMSEMGEMESLRLQMAMDRMSKMMSTLSNLLKKVSDTADGITQNLK
jgi:hypothetical protein